MQKYTVMKKAQLQELCLEHGLSDVGDRKTLISRLEQKAKTPPPTLTVYRNEKGNYTDTATGYTFDPYTKKVIGKEDAQGQIARLQPDDYLECVKHGFSW